MDEIKLRVWEKNKKVMNYQKSIELFEDSLNIRFNRFDISTDILGHIAIMQYIGMKDTNGKEIYENDIVKMHYFYEGHDPETLGATEEEREIVGIVENNEFTLCVLDIKDRGSSYIIINCCEDPSEQIEIIGNIYENPEMLNELD